MTLSIVSVASLAIMLAFATSITGSGVHRNAVTLNSAMQTAAAELTAAVQQQPTTAFASCSAALHVTQTPPTLNLPTGYTATITGVQYWTGSTWSPSTPQPVGGSCPTGTAATAGVSGLQLLTVSVTHNGNTSTTTAVTSNTAAPVSGQDCNETGQKFLVWESQPGNGLAGQALFPSPTLVIEDGSGTPCRNDASAVTLAITHGTGTAGASLSNCVTSRGGVGQTTFQNCSIGTPGTGYTLTATDATDGLTSPASAAFNIGAGVPVKLFFETSPVSGTGGTPFATTTHPIVVWVEDNSGNVVSTDNTVPTLAIGANPGGGALSGCTGSSNGAGVVSYTGCKIDKVGTGYTLTATDAADNLTTASAPSGPFNIAPGPAAQLVFTTSPGTTVVGTALAPNSVVIVEDAGGNPTTTNMGTVSLAIGNGPSGATLSGCTQATTGSTVTFSNCVINKTGTGYTLVATDSGFASTATSTPFNVVLTTPTIATTLSVSTLTPGGSAHDSATLTGAASSTGTATVTYSYYTNNTCTTGQVVVNSVTVPTSGTVPNSNTVIFNTPGTYYWQAVYSGDANNNGASSPCTAGANEQLAVKYSPTIATTLAASNISAGASTNDSATLTGAASSTGTATVTYSYYTNSTCTTGQVTVNSVTVGTNGLVPNSSAATVNAVGTYYWQAVYSGDANNFGVSSPCTATNNEKLTVAKASPTLTATGPVTGSAGIAITAANISSVFAASSGSNASGTITFKVFGPSANAPTSCTTGGTTVGTGVTVNGNGTYNPSAGFTPTTVGNYWWYASYNGDTNNNAAISTCGSGMSKTVVAQASPTLTVTGPGTGTIGTAITATNISSAFGASSGTNATGTITFKVFGPSANAPTSCTTGGTTVGTGVTVNGNGTYNPSAGFTPTTVGNYWWYASYNGDINNFAATSTCGSLMSETVVAKASPSVTATGPGTGTIATAISTTNISSVLTGGTAAPAVTGTITFTVFGPQSNAPTTCTSGGTTVGAGTTVNGNATYHPTAAFTPPGAGDYWWYASYGGDTNNNTATSTCGAGMSETVVSKASPAVTVAGPGTGTSGSLISTTNISSVLSAGTTAPAVTGTVTFTVFGPSNFGPNNCTTGGTLVGTATVNGNGTYNPTVGFTPTAAGNYWWYASYGGDANNNPATSTCGFFGMSETVVGKATPTLTATGPGTGSAGSAITTTSISSAFGSSSGTNATGTITFKVFGPSATAPTTCTAGTTVGTATVNGNGTYNPSASFTPTGAGNYWWYASYGGDTNNNTATSTCGSGMSETVVAQATPTLTATGPGTGNAGSAITTTNISSAFGASSGANATGTITFKVFGPLATAPTTCTAGTTVGTATVSGNNTYNPSASFTPTTVGNYWWYASYGGDANNATAASTCGSGMSETVVAVAAPTLTATGPGAGNAGTAITTANISSALGASSGANATGTITFTVFGPQTTAPTTCTAGTTVGTATVAGNNTYHPSAGFTPTTVGNYWWYASYGGDANNGAATSTCGSGMSKTVVAPAITTLTATGPGTGTIGTAISTANVSAALSGGTSIPEAGGIITFTVFGPQTSAPTTCTSGGTTVGAGTAVNGDATYHPSATFTPTGAGDYWWYASYGGDANNSAATSPCGATMSETQVAKFSPSVTVTGPGTGKAGTAIAASNINPALSGGTTNAAVTGTITVTVFGPSATAPTTCTAGTTVGTATVNGNGTYNPSASFTPTGAGNYWWYASLWRGHQQQHGDLDLWLGDVRDSGRPGHTDADGDGARNRQRG